MDETVTPQHADAAATSADAPERDELIDELLVEEISIDGMCGVY